jgi:serine phosphatase RsbU (regulator of sigma subunit)
VLLSIFLNVTSISEPVFGDSITWFLIITNLVILIGAWFMIRRLSNRFEDENKKLSEKLSERSYNVMVQKWDLERRNILITQRNQEITESLQYARNIQLAIMTGEDLIDSWFKQAFILYKPKDIVSGDFYFLERSGDHIFLAAADCTGHGVAGAFMSMLGNALLKQIIIQNKIHNPSIILQHLNDGIVEALHQKDNDSHGGMDIALCSINLLTKKIEFAGANRPLLLIRNNEQLIFSPDKLPIGGFSLNENRIFTKKEISFNEDDIFYLFTDGYADQFGGADGKKIMTKKFKELLLQIHTEPMLEQKKLLNVYLEKWQGKFEQVDDVLVIGIKL